MKITLECIHCCNKYDYNESTATTQELRTIFCTKECEDAEDARLREGNEIVASALKNDPLSLAHSLSPLVSELEIPRPSGEMGHISKIVDGVFARFERDKSEEK